MPNYRLSIYLTLLLVAIANTKSTAQQAVPDTNIHKQVIARPAAPKSAFFERMWGHNNRVEWNTPVDVPVLWLDTALGGLRPYKMGGGNETKSLRLRAANGKEYVLRSINKCRDEVVPPKLKGTFLEDIINDGVTMSYPYGSFAVAGMQQQAGIPHTLPTLVYLPSQKALDTFDVKCGNSLYLLEQKTEGNWSEADNLGNFSRFVNTEDVIASVQANSHHKADQPAFIKARLFDMLIGDWDRHEGNWSWGVRDSGNTIWYIPVPQDRDQAFFTHDGFMIDKVLKGGGLSFMQNFDGEVKNIATLNTSGRYIDRFFTSALTLNNWLAAARELQQQLTDAAIEGSVRQLPPEIFAESGKRITEILKKRREQLPQFAKEYYLFLSKEIEITGTDARDYFEVNSNAKGETTVRVFAVNNQGQPVSTPYYTRQFLPAEVKEIRLYGLDDKDVFVVNNQSKAIKIRVLGGQGNDALQHTGRKIHVYDDPANPLDGDAVRGHITDDTALNNYNYRWFHYNKKGFHPTVFYNNADRFYVGVSSNFKNYKWRKGDKAITNAFDVHYSFSQNAISAEWQGIYPDILGKWDLIMKAGFDAIRWTNFYGTGNESKNVTNDLNYYRLRTQEWTGSAGLQRQFNGHTIEASAYYQYINGRYDTERYPSKVFPEHADVYRPNQYAGIKATYSWAHVNDSVVAERGFTFLANGTYAHNFTQKETYQLLEGRFQWYVPILDRVSLAVRGGGATVINNDVLATGQFYEHAVLGGPRNLRGYRRERFWGKTMAYVGNELRYITDMRTHFMNARVGVFGFFDAGRVWMPGEESHKIHTSYGPGFMIAPFNKISLSLSYGITDETRLFQIRVNTLF